MGRYDGEDYELGPPCSPGEHSFAMNGNCWHCRQDRKSLEAQPDGKKPEKIHYVECHVIVSGDPEGNSLPHAKLDGWWGSRLNEDGSNEEKPGDLILTTRRNTQEDAVGAIRMLAEKLRDVGYNVTRGKTEIVNFDTKLGDVLYASD